MALEINRGEWKQFLHLVSKDDVNANLTGATQTFIAVGPNGQTISHSTSGGGVELTNPTGSKTAANPTGAQSTLTLEPEDTNGFPNVRTTFSYQWTTTDNLGHPTYDESGVLVMLAVLVAP